MKQAPKKLATLCALIGAGISCAGVGHAENSLKEQNAWPATDAASRFQPAILPVTQSEKRIASPGRRTGIASNMTPSSAAGDEIEKLWLAWQESETMPPSLPRNEGHRTVDAMLLKQENAPRKLAKLTHVPPNSVVELPAAVPNDVVVVMDDGQQQPDNSTGNQWIAGAGNAGLWMADSASPDNAADAIHATLKTLSERRPELFALASGEALPTTSHVPVLEVQPAVSSNRLTHSAPVTDLAQPENIALQSKQADEIKKNRSKQSPAREWLAVSNNSLDEMRGGFDNGAGLMVSFGIERAVYINGNLTTSVSFNIPDVGKFAADQAKIATNQAMLAVDQAKVAAEQAKVTADQARLVADQARITAVQAGAAAGQTAVAAAQAGLSEQVRVANEQVRINSEQARLSSEQAKINSEQARLTSEQAKIGSVTGATANLVQNGPGNTFQPGPLPQTVAATVIQNTLNNQSIKSLTVINTTVNSLSALKALNAQTSLRDALGNSLGVR